MSKYDAIATKIIKEQESIIGPVAWAEAGKVTGLQIVDQKAGTVTVSDSNSKQVLDNLVNQYESLFGKAAREACKEAAMSLLADLSPGDVPSSLK